MVKIAKGLFQVEMKPQGLVADGAEGKVVGRMSLAKRYEGDLVAEGFGEMLSSMGAVKGSAGYVAIERVSGTLAGKSGSFVLQHSGHANRGAKSLAINIVADSGTGEWAGISGTCEIDVVDGKHLYTLVYDLP